MKNFAWATAAVVLLTATACQADSNPLIGNWVMSGPGAVDRDGFNWCAATPRLVFTATTQTIYTAASKFRPAYQTATAVHYLVSGNKVYASSTEGFGGAPFYTITGPGKMVSGDMAHCSYAKQ